MDHPPSHNAGRDPAAAPAPSPGAPCLRAEGPGLRAVPVSVSVPVPASPQGPVGGGGFAGSELALPQESEPKAADLGAAGPWAGAAGPPRLSAHIPVPALRVPPGATRLEEVMAAAALTSLSTSTLLLGAPAAAFSPEPGLEPWKEPLVQPPGSCCSSGDWAWDLASDQSSSPATPSPPLPPEAVHFLFGEPALRKRKGPAQVLFQCLWKRCGKVLNSASGMHRHIRLAHLGRQAELEQSDGEEDFYYTELDMSMDALAEGLSSLTPTSPAATAPPAFPLLELPEPTALPSLPALSSGSTTEVFHRDHAYQGCPAPTSLQLLPAVRACAPALPSKCGTNTRKVCKVGSSS
ncbi:SLC2A4 regulator isoform X2 [Erinaceus europaeus]|uniref:SLC2A4 regulator isoform X2 n=1 Tax=Erinaceus europaeus TaxID=9365 RepID=A0A1S3WCV8_ERIEU|nr:SLC2A4 regulator isoform X2 [Erinaceus europaeus]